ncbi:hypothetical protein [Butyrivibrio sp. WCD3002]|uniref:hypothetical protein n=1 Tax=Butyrivibrio sp. WCD3002 TaxID=1280676 RepID=UPI000415D2FD|nr:hypothetical protein [Butyrivibrio sp. WCD3002]
MNIKRVACVLKRVAVAACISGAIFFFAPVMPASTVHAESCGHEVYEWVELIKPTCSKEGKRVRICQDCEKVLETEAIDKTEHKGKWEKTQDATCSAEGVKSYICKNCSEVLETEDIPRKKHVFLWTTTKDPTCEEEGLKQQICKYCDAEGESKAIPAKGHRMVKRKTTAATCRSPKLIEKECSLCGITTTEREGSTIDHRYKWATTTAATCADAGVKTGTCSMCGGTKSEAIAPTGKHKYGNWSIESAQINGKVLKLTQSRTCKVCGRQKQTVTGKTAPFSKKHDKKKYYYKLTQKTGRVVILCTDCRQSVTGKISSGALKFTKPKKDKTRTISKAWKRLKIEG